jgi:hypothetical protein
MVLHYNKHALGVFMSLLCNHLKREIRPQGYICLRKTEFMGRLKGADYIRRIYLNNMERHNFTVLQIMFA